MKIKEMFKDDIDRTINGVVQVEQEKEDVIEQEVKEYVVTTELKKHFTKFFNEYSESFDRPTDNVGVWITGFFGSGKSHFLKMLSYLLENKEINGKKTVDYFEEKFDDQLSFMNVQKCVQVPTETILFNIDVEGSMHKDDTAVLKVFAKVFYDHLGYYGNDLKLAKLEQFITKQGKMDAFKEAYEDINGESWLDTRAEYQFFEQDVVDALVEADVMNENTAQHWFDGTETADISIAQLVDEIKAYVDSKPKGFRLLFMIDEAGQYIGTNTSMLLNLQSLIEKLGSVCRGQVWIVATGQEALDEMIKVRQDEFSRIMARFAIRLSLTSSSVGEVIEKRLLTKTDEANTILDGVYENNKYVLSNLYAFDTELKDLKGYSSEDEFARIFPFVPYQFTIMQKVFNEIRKHGHAGKHQSSGERSMLNGFQESAQHIEDKNELTLVPMYAFYDTLHSFLDTSVRSVIERAERAASNNNGLTEDDTNLLKLLYLVRYIDDIKSNIDNLTILMVDTIMVDMLELRKQVEESLNRLQRQNYIARNGDIYQFLTDEEQDIEREISNQSVDSANVISRVCSIIFDDLYTTKKYRYSKNDFNYDFEFDKSVDGQNHGLTTGGMKLRFVTEAYEDPSTLKLSAESSHSDAICQLSTEFKIFDGIEHALKIDKYIKQKNVSQLPESIQNIITNKQKEARRLLNEAKEKINNAIINGTFYIGGRVVSISGTSVQVILNKALEMLVEHTYHSINMIDHSVSSDADIRKILTGAEGLMDGMEPNKEACEELYKYLEMKKMNKLPTSMSDIQSRYQSIPFGWKEIDIAAVVARLIYEQKVTIKHQGSMIQPSNTQLPDYLRKKSETGSTNISIREVIPAQKMKAVRDILKDYFDVMDVPNDEDGLVAYIVKEFNNEKSHLEDMNKQNDSTIHPGSSEIKEALSLVNKVLLAQSDNIALINTICDLEDDLLDSKDDMRAVENFYSSQIKLYDSALNLNDSILDNEKDFLYDIPEVKDAIEKIKEITKVSNTFKYNRIPELNTHIATINSIRTQEMNQKRVELKSLIDDCMNEIMNAASDNQAKVQPLIDNAKDAYNKISIEIDQLNNLLGLYAKSNRIVAVKDSIVNQIQRYLTQTTTVKEDIKEYKAEPKQAPKKKVRELQRNVIFREVELSSAEDVDRYLASIKNRLLSYINDDEQIKLK
jgi:hypothetical protein